MEANQSNQPKAKVLVNTAARLHAAIYAEEALKKGRVSEHDRVTFARNLGKMFEKSKAHFPELSLRKLFIEIFGETSGESFYKKRNRLVTLSGDKSESKSLSQLAWQYTAVAKGLAKYIEAPTNYSDGNKQTIAILRLIEASSFDPTTAHVDRFNQEYSLEIDKQLRHLAEKVASNVDLEWMRTWSDLHSIPIVGQTGSVTEISYSNRNKNYYAANLNLNGPIHNSLSPCVRLGKIVSKMPIEKFIDIDVVDHCSDMDLADAILGGLSQALSLEFSLFVGMDHDEISQAVTNSEIWKRTPNADTKDARNSYKSCRVLDLELRYEISGDTWQPCFLSRLLVEEDSAIFAGSSIQEALPDLEILCLDYGNQVILVAKKISPTTYRVFPIEIPEYMSRIYVFNDDPEERISNWSTRPFRGIYDIDAIHPLDDRYLHFLLDTESSDTSSVYFDCEIHIGETSDHLQQSNFVKAPDFSLSYYILRNLAYAPIDKRLDQLLMKDARRKYDMLREYETKAMKEYEEAISKF